MDKLVICIDMDNVLVDFESALKSLGVLTLEEYKGRYDEIPRIFGSMLPMKNAVESFKLLAKHHDVYIVSTAPWNNSSAWADKNEWVKRYLGDEGYKRLILTHHKNLIRGDYIIDDRTKNGVDTFQGHHLHFGTDSFPDWESVLEFFGLSLSQ